MLCLSHVPFAQDNYIWLLHRENRPEVVVIDPGAAEPVLAWLAQYHKVLGAIWLTHHHADHSMGIAPLLRHHPVPVYGPALSQLAEVSHPLSGAQSFLCPVLEQSVTVLATPGHTLDHISFYAEPYLFCGDTLFAAGCGRLFEGTAAQMIASLELLAAQPLNTYLCPGHEYTEANLVFACHLQNDKQTTERLAQVRAQRQRLAPTLPVRLETEWQTNPFLRILRERHYASFQLKAKDTGQRWLQARRLKDQFQA